MTYNQKLDFLKQYQDANHRGKAIALEIEQLRAEAECVTPMLSGMPGGGGSTDKIPIAVERIIDAQQRLHAATINAQEQIALVITAINTVSDGRLRELLVRRYIRGQRWEEIAWNMNCCYQHAHVLHKKAVKLVNIAEDLQNM